VRSMLLRTALCRSTSAGARSLHTALLRREPRAAPLLRAAPSRASGTFHHVKEADNLEETPFEFDEEAEKEIAFTLNKYPDTLQGRQSGIMPLLWIVQAQLDRAHATIKADNPRGAMAFPKSQGGGGWVPLAAMHKIAERLGCSHMDVYEVATFFTMYNREKRGRFHIMLCATTPCMVCGAYDIMHTIEKHLGIKAGETTADGEFTLTEVECLGACVNAPMVQVNDMFFENLTTESTVQLLDNLKAGNPVKIGPQNGLTNSEGPMGRTSLIEPPLGPQCRDLGA